MSGVEFIIFLGAMIICSQVCFFLGKSVGKEKSAYVTKDDFLKFGYISEALAESRTLIFFAKLFIDIPEKDLSSREIYNILQDYRKILNESFEKHSNFPAKKK